MSSILPHVTLEPFSPARAVVIWLHGLGSDGHDFEPLFAGWETLREQGVRFILPHAPFRRITINHGAEMRAWYNITGFGEKYKDDLPGILESVEKIRALMKAQDNLPIIVGGFSQGGAMSLIIGLTTQEPLKGIIGLSTYLPCRDTLSRPTLQIPILLMHGTTDPLLPLALVERSYEPLKQWALPVTWQTFPVGHNVSLEEMSLVEKWIAARFS